jgi:hypothetical protein
MSYLTTPTETVEYLSATPRNEAAWAARVPSHAFWNSAFWRHFPHADDTAETLASETLRYHRLHPSAFVKLSPPGTTMAAGYGLSAKWQGDSLGRRTILKRPVQKLADWQCVLNGSFNPEITGYLLQSARQVGRAAEGELVLQTVFAPLTIATQLAGLPLLHDHLAAAPAFMQAVLQALSCQVREVMLSLTKCGIQGVYLATQSMNRSSFSPEEYAIWGRPYDAACIAAAACLPCNVFHLHGDGVSLAIPELPANWVLHYEWSSSNPPLDECLRATRGPVFVGLPASQLAAFTLLEDRRQFLIALNRKIGQRPAFLTPGCCLPLDFPDFHLAGWREAASGVSRDLSA